MSSFLIWPKVYNIVCTVLCRHDQLVCPPPLPPYTPSNFIPPPVSGQWGGQEVVYIYIYLGVHFGQPKNDDSAFSSEWPLVYGLWGMLYLVWKFNLWGGPFIGGLSLLLSPVENLGTWQISLFWRQQFVYNMGATSALFQPVVNTVMPVVFFCVLTYSQS